MAISLSSRRALSARLAAGGSGLMVGDALGFLDSLASLDRAGYDAILVEITGTDAGTAEMLRDVRSVAGDASIIAIADVMPDELGCFALRAGADDAFAWRDATYELVMRSILYVRERNQARAQRVQLTVLLDSAPDAMLVVNAAGAVRYVNRAAVKLFGRSRDELRAECLGFSVRDGEASEVVISTAAGQRIGEMRLVSITWEGQPARLATIRDTTERVLAEQLRIKSDELERRNREIESASRMKSAFVANMSHELRTPLNAIIGFASLLHGGHAGALNADQREFLGDILRSGEHLLGLIQDVLDIAKIEAGRIELAPHRFLLASSIAEVVEVLRPLAAERRIRLDVVVDASIDEVEIDPLRLRQVLYNYVSNALKFSREGGDVIIRARAEPGDAFRLEVEDTGIGIAQHDLGRLFHEFQQLDAGTGKRFQGAGIGLALTKRLVEAHGGRVGVRSTLGVGSVFYAILPRTLQPPSANGACSAPPPSL